MAKLAADLEGNRMDDLASMGRFGDTMVAHINPQEAQMLMQEGGSGTINPMTGLPEFYFDDPGFMGGGAEGDIGEQGIDFSGQDFADTTSLDPSDPTGLSVEAGEPFTEEQLATAGSFNKKFDNVIEVARNRPNINETSQDFITRLANSIEGKTQSPDGQNIGLTQDEIANLGFYTDNPDDPRFGSYLGYNSLVSINAPQSREEENARQDVAYTDRLNVEFKEKGLDAKIEPDPQNPGNYVYSGPDAAQAMFGQVFGAIGSLGKTAASMAYNASSMLPTRIMFDAITGGKLIGPDFKEVAPSLGGLIGKETGLTNAFSSMTNSVKSALGIGTEKPADKISVNKSGEITEASREGKDINVSGVPSAEETIENILNQDAMMTPDSPEAYFGTSPQTGLPTDEQFLDMTSGDVPAYSVSDFEDLTLNSARTYTPAGKVPTASEYYDSIVRDRLGEGENINLAPDYQALADERRDDYLSTLDLNTASTLVDPATAAATAFVDQPDRFDDPGGNEPIVRRKPRPVVSQVIDEVVEEDKPYFPKARLPRLTESGLKTLQYTLRNDPEALQNIYNKYALPEQYSGLKALV